MCPVPVPVRYEDHFAYNQRTTMMNSRHRRNAEMGYGKMVKHAIPLVATLTLLAAAQAWAVEPELEAEQVNIDTSTTQVVGGVVAQRLAQAFTLDRPGRLSHVMVPMVCEPDATVLITIEKTKAGVPNGSVLAYKKLPGTLFTSVTTPAVGMRMVEFDKPVSLGAGLYAFTLRTDSSCGAYIGPSGNTYPAGRGYFMSNDNAPGWIELFDAEGVRDMAFQVYIRPL